jgi:hypothetical protein
MNKEHNVKKQLLYRLKIIMFYSQGGKSVNTSFEQRKNYLYVKVSGDYNDDVAKSTLNKIFNECRECNYSKVLLDAHDIDLKSVSILNRFYMGVEIAELSTRPSLIKVGCVVRKQYFDGLSVTVAKNRGAQFQAFHDKNKALKWLSE